MSDQWLEQFVRALDEGDHDGRLHEIIAAAEKRRASAAPWPQVALLADVAFIIDSAASRHVMERSAASGDANVKLRQIFQGTTNPHVLALATQLRIDLLVRLLDVPPEAAQRIATDAARHVDAT